jgi:ATP phosphoribosyltransferase regulatory subunit
VPKGKLYDESVVLLSRAGFALPGLAEPGRALCLRDEEGRFEVIIAKPTDVAIYVSRGAVDAGIGGRDILVEADFPLLQLTDLRFGECEFVVAAPEAPPGGTAAAAAATVAPLSGSADELGELSLRLGTLRVATKYPRLTQRFFDARGIQVEIVKLNGNIELAPLIGIADVIVDITQTGTTLRENRLRVVERVLPSTARFVANAVAARSDERVAELAARLAELVEEEPAAGSTTAPSDPASATTADPSPAPADPATAAVPSATGSLGGAGNPTDSNDLSDKRGGMRP